MAGDIARFRTSLSDQDTTVSAFTETLLGKIDEKAALKAFISTTPDLARQQAAASDARMATGEPRPLEGVAVSIKDNFCVAGHPTTAGSHILDNFVPTYDAHVVTQLKEAGAVFVGKTNLDEFGMGSTTDNPRFGQTLNPRGMALGQDDISAGGSSGGAAASVAADLCHAAIGTDTGGSIRQPASFCGVVGMKPTYGLCSRRGIIAYASSLDQAGVIAKTVEDTAAVLDVIIDHDPQDSTSVAWDKPALADSLDASDPSALKIGVPVEFREKGGSDDLKRVWSELEDKCTALGVSLVPVSLPSINYALPAYYIIAMSEASSNLARYDGARYGQRVGDDAALIDMYEQTRAQGFGHEVQRRIMLGTFALSAGYYDQYYARAQRVRRIISNEFATAFGEVDVLAWPTTPEPAFPFGAHSGDPISLYLQDVYTVPVNLAGLPAISVPFSEAGNGLPMGLTLAAARMDDDKVLSAARMLVTPG